MRTIFRIIACAVGIAFSLQCPGDTIFSKGELSTTKNHTGNVWLKELNAGDSTFDYALAVATFEAGGKAGLAQPSRWSNPAYSGRHWLLSGKRTANTNCPQRDVIKCLPGVEHWHGASPTSGFTYLATTPTQKEKQFG
jgi:4-carboxymuconolactone decarboxylase